MAQRVFLHVGTPKTGTTYLQTILWQNREALRDQGVLFPGERRADHLYASLVVRGADNVVRRHERAPSSWDRLQRAARRWEGTVVISHEFFGAATPKQANGVIEALAPAEVHVVVTARDLVSLFPSRWQEQVKHLATMPLSEYAPDESDDPLDVWGWRTMDVSGVLRRWTTAIPAHQVHVITMPQKGSPPGLLLERFATLIGFDPTSCDETGAKANDSLGLVEVELMRRVNPYLAPALTTPREVGRWLRGCLGRQFLTPRNGASFGPTAEQIATLTERSREVVTYLRDSGFDIIGDLNDLLPVERSTPLPDPSSVTDAELVEAAAETIAELVLEIRRLSS